MKTYIPSFELKRVDSEYVKVKIKDSKEAADYCRQFFFNNICIYESMFMITLNRGSWTTGWVKVSQGGISGTVCDIRLIAKYALDALASGIILCHNHPSGELTPSSADMSIAKKVRDTLKIFDCTLIDSIIINENSYYSLANNGEI